MADENGDFYSVLGLKKECTNTDLRNEYRKLAMKWHPDRCSSSGNSEFVEEAKVKFQAIQQAYSVLSDDNKRFLYDLGVYDSNDDDDENGMGEFLNEMASMMNQNKSNENGNESFEDLQQLFEEMFHGDIEGFNSSCRFSPTCSSSSQASCSETYVFSNKRSSSEMNSTSFSVETTQFEGFCLGTGKTSGKNVVGENIRRRNIRAGRKR